MGPEQQTSTEDRPCIMLLSIETEAFFDEQYNRLLNALSDRARVVRARTTQSALNFLENNIPSAIFVTDAGLIRRKTTGILPKLTEYVSNGGRIIFGGHFSSFAPPLKIHPLFRKNFGLPWESASYHRTDFHLNPVAAENLGSSQQLASCYSQKALHLKNVGHAAAIYLPGRESRIQSLVFSPERITNLEETPTAWAKVGQGWVGYIGDVNAEEDTDTVVLSMCGV
ncbi:hypothetical protein LOZ07_001264 [Ophidiomyces ophidiicola]|nr:hypothetical protein LOZ60_002926 [Ophidiomyces ophidiicola]KAI2076592.1 hypothetical protein LOZ37_003081 [Ophidiomyces ophidiicola]KAI2203988.1 hypothetical protein LOZ20_000458 [Ophidiomyces ophidiicola]KAI2209016.1 hypothetical protein LOZ16_003220 [Ophidiomyces ophidiicola]KAI2301644.1 hypothetical protein LOZ07_001264 [Ophidiomyces ophidiicola]